MPAEDPFLQLRLHLNDSAINRPCKLVLPVRSWLLPFSFSKRIRTKRPAWELAVGPALFNDR